LADRDHVDAVRVVSTTSSFVSPRPTMIPLFVITGYPAISLARDRSLRAPS
jgi:hypothetical protein